MYLLLLTCWTKCTEAEVIQHMLPAVCSWVQFADSNCPPYAHCSWISDCHLRLSSRQQYSHQYENHSSITASIKEIIRSTQLLLENALGLSASGGNGKLYIKRLICTRLQIKSIRNIATGKYTSSRDKYDVLIFGWFFSLAGWTKKNSLHNSSCYLLWPVLCTFVCSYKKMKAPTEDDTLIVL